MPDPAALDQEADKGLGERSIPPSLDDHAADHKLVFPADRSDRYTLVEISVFEGRSAEVKKALIRALYHRVPASPR
jgi:hypothetical protein